MSSKRVHDLSDFDSSDQAPSSSSSSTPSPKKARRSSVKTAWTADEEARFLAAIDAVVKKHLWLEVKGDSEIAKRGANGVRSHWDAMLKKMKK